MPKCAHFINSKSAITHSDFVFEAIQDLLKINRIIEVNELPHVVNPLSVTVQNYRKKRLILDLCYVNRHIFKERFEFGDLKLTEQFLNIYGHVRTWLNKAIIILIFINHITSFLVFHDSLLDDCLGVSSSYKMTLFHSNFEKTSLQNAGFIINKEKSVWKPTQTLILSEIRTK